MTEGTRRPDRVLSFLSLSLKVPGRRKTLDSRRETLAEIIDTQNTEGRKPLTPPEAAGAPEHE